MLGQAIIFVYPFSIILKISNLNFYSNYFSIYYIIKLNNYKLSMQPFPKKEPLFESFIQETKNSKALFQKELDVNQAEQNLLVKRIDLMKSSINELSADDPQYSMLIAQLQMDRLELDELKRRESLLIEKLEI